METAIEIIGDEYFFLFILKMKTTIFKTMFWTAYAVLACFRLKQIIDESRQQRNTKID